MSLENNFGAAAEAYRNPHLEAIAEKFGQEVEVEKGLDVQDYLGLVFSNILSKKVYLQGRTREEDTIYYLNGSGQIKKLEVRRDNTTNNNNTESFGGEPIADALMEIPETEDVLYLIKQSELYEGREGDSPQIISPRAKAKLEKNIPNEASDSIIEVYEFDKEKMYRYINEHRDDWYVKDVLSRSANAAKFNWWLSEY